MLLLERVRPAMSGAAKSMPKRKVGKAAWWERELPSLREDLLRYSRARVPSLALQHADLVQETLLGITKELRHRSDAYPPSWRSAGEPPEDARRHFRAFAITILRRRIADHFAAQARAWARHVLSGAEEASPSDGERRHLIEQLLAIAVERLQQESEEDRALLMRSTLEHGVGRALTASERQRLHRLRDRLDEAVRARLGAGARELIAGSEES